VGIARFTDFDTLFFKDYVCQHDNLRVGKFLWNALGVLRVQ